MISKKKAYKKPKSKFYWRFEIVAFAAVLGIGLLISIVLQNQPSIPLRVIDFSWKGKTVGVQDRYFTLTFNRPVDRSSIEQNLQIQPPLPGKISWIGQRMFYTLLDLPVYGVTYQLRLEGAKELDYKNQLDATFESRFSTRDLAWAYIGIKGEEKGKLLLYNLNQDKKSILTPANLVVTNFEIYPDGNRILFSAFDRTNKTEEESQQLYTVTTGLNSQLSDNPQPSGQIERILEIDDSQNLSFDLSADGKSIVVQKKNLSFPMESSLWVLSNSTKLKPLGISGNKFVISPDSQTVAVVQPQGIAIVPLNSNNSTREFLTRYKDILGFFRDGSQKVMVKLNDEVSTKSLLLVDIDGEERELFQTKGSILECQFEPRWEHTLYCLTTEVLPGKEEEPEELALIAIDIETAQNFPLLALPNYKDVHISISPDGLSLLFDQIVINTSKTDDQLYSDDGSPIAAGLLWLLTIPDIQTADRSNIIPPTELFPGFKPHWFP